MAQNGAEFEWDAVRLEAAELLADGRLTDEAIAEKLAIGRRTLTRWKEFDAFRAKVAEIATALEAAILRRGIARRFARVRALDDRWNRMQQVIAERAADPAMATVRGGTTGLIVRDIKGVGKGEDFQLVELFSVDTGLLAELRQHEKQAAQELGQWVEKLAPTTPDGEEQFDGGTEGLGALAIELRAALDAIGSGADPAADSGAPEGGPASLGTVQGPAAGGPPDEGG